MAAMYPEVYLAGVVDSHDVAREDVADACDHLYADVLATFFYTVDGALASAERFCKLCLCKAAC